MEESSEQLTDNCWQKPRKSMRWAGVGVLGGVYQFICKAVGSKCLCFSEHENESRRGVERRKKKGESWLNCNNNLHPPPPHPPAKK